MHAALIYGGTTWFDLSVYQFAAVNMTVACIWILVAWRIGGEYRVLANNGEESESKQPA
jgi:hypothetical protein